MNAKSRILLHLPDFLQTPLLRSELPGRIGILVRLLPLGHLLPDVSFNLGWILHGLGAQNSHQISDSQLRLWGRLKTQSDFLLLLLPSFPAILAPDLLPLLLGEEYRHVDGTEWISGCSHLSRMLNQVGDGATLENHLSVCAMRVSKEKRNTS
jgi:hypothetical protein